MSSTLAGAFGVAALFVAVLALVFAIQALRARTDTSSAPAPRPEPEPAPEPEPKPGTVKSELRKLGKELAVTRAELKDTLQHLAVVRYDAFEDTGGHLSWSLALLDDHGDGAVLTAIHGRNEARSYAKSITGWTCEQQLSPEEEEAITHARPE